MSTFGWIALVVGIFAMFWVVLGAIFFWRMRREDKMDNSAPAPTQYFSHPIFGHLVPDEWEQLMTFRRFEFMRLFWKSEGSQCMSLLSKHERVCVEKWSEYMVPLARVCRRTSVYESLRSLGVFEVWLETPRKGKPTPSQEKAYQHFLTHEKKICENVIDALARYYRLVREAMPDWFNKEYPFNPDNEQLARLVELDGFTILRASANGVSPLQWSWSPLWDEEHGLKIIMFQGQVILVDTDAELMLEAPAGFIEDTIWKREHMTDVERAALDEFIAGFKPEK